MQLEFCLASEMVFYSTATPAINASMLFLPLVGIVLVVSYFMSVAPFSIANSSTYGDGSSSSVHIRKFQEQP